MRLSTIRKQEVAGAESRFSSALGSEIRRRRLALGLSQASIGGPLSRAFMSRLEQGRLTPSLPSLIIIARRLNSSGSEILATVESKLDGERSDEDQRQTPFSC
jgi:transcriptional regulator with XRE-family HTH domain